MYVFPAYPVVVAITSEWGICPYGIWYPWVRGGWGLDALEKFFRRRRRRRPPGFGKTFRVSLRNRTFRSARIDPSSLPKHRRTNLTIFLSYKKIKYQKTIKKRSKTGKNRHSRKIPYRNIPHSYPLKGAVMYIYIYIYMYIGYVQKWFLEHSQLFPTIAGPCWTISGQKAPNN